MNPYDLVKVSIYGVDVYARPIEFSATIVDHKKYLDAFGRLVVPTKVVLTCPVCGSPVYYEFVGICNCNLCEVSRPQKKSPFVDPIRKNRIKLHELMEHVYNPDVGFNIDVNLEKRKAVFSDFIEYDNDNKLPKSDLGLEDMVDE